MKVTQTEVDGALLIELDVWRDARGRFAETFQVERYAASGLDATFVQDDFSFSTGNVLRGLHYQVKRPQGHLVTVLRGRVFDVGLDLRAGSPTFGQTVGRVLDAEGPQQLYLPPGLAHGFCVLSEETEIHYKCTDIYQPGDEAGVLWSDPDLAIAWPIEGPVLSDKDTAWPRLRDVPPERLPHI